MLVIPFRCSSHIAGLRVKTDCSILFVLHSQKWHLGSTLLLYLCLHTQAVDAESAPLLDFSRTTFWMQTHNVPAHLATQEIGESIGKTLR